MIFIVTEDAPSALVVQRFLEAKSCSKFGVINAGGKSAAESLARSMALTHEGPVLLVVSAGTYESLASEVADIEDYLNAVLPRGSCNLVLAVPSIRQIAVESLGLKENDDSTVHEAIHRATRKQVLALEQVNVLAHLFDVVSEYEANESLRTLKPSFIDEMEVSAILFANEVVDLDMAMPARGASHEVLLPVGPRSRARVADVDVSPEYSWMSDE